MISTMVFTLALAANPNPAGEFEPGHSAVQRPRWREVGGFVGVDWRVMGLARHLSHGPGFQAGVTVLGHLGIAIAGFARPGPINPKTFGLDLPPGETYRGQRRIRLRSDGAVVGAQLFAFHDFRRVPLSLETPVLIGYAGFGFYLSGQDRDVPDDRRVSAWEDELLDGADSDPVSLAVDVGVRLAWTPPRTPHVRPFVGIHYAWILGFDATIRDDYDGFSGVLGVKFGKFGSRRR